MLDEILKGMAIIIERSGRRVDFRLKGHWLKTHRRVIE